MKYEYNKSYDIDYTELDSNAKLSLTSSVSLVQNMVTEYFESFKSDNLRIKLNNNALWVLTKTKLKFNILPTWRDKVFAEAYTTKNSAIRSESEILFSDNKNNLMFVAKQEYCVIDIDTRKIRKISSIDYPKDMEFGEEVYKETFSKIKEEFSDSNYIYKQKVYAPDIDFSHHTNNVIYVRYLLNTLSSEYLKDKEIDVFEIHYISESIEDDDLKIYKKEMENSVEFLIKENDREVVRAILIFK